MLACPVLGREGPRGGLLHWAMVILMGVVGVGAGGSLSSGEGVVRPCQRASPTWCW